MAEDTRENNFREGIIHFTGGAIGGTVGTAFTCPLEVVKTRMQSSRGGVGALRRPALDLFKEVWREGNFRALYKGLGPNLIGVTPSKAIYFCTYSLMKRSLNTSDYIEPDTAAVHMISAAAAAATAAVMVNPIWVIKTRLQLSQGRLSAFQCARRIYSREGGKGFYKGLSGSLLGVGETMMQFVLYEWLRSLINDPNFTPWGKEDSNNFAHFMLAGGLAKLAAGITFYPHEVIRTRLREEHSVETFRGTIRHIWKEGGLRAFYRGLTVQLFRSVPNTAITMGVYELVVFLLHSRLLPSHSHSPSSS